jgi:hypothetical protein
MSLNFVLVTIMDNQSKTNVGKQSKFYFIKLFGFLCPIITNTKRTTFKIVGSTIVRTLSGI